MKEDSCASRCYFKTIPVRYQRNTIGLYTLLVIKFIIKVGAKPARPHGVAPRAHADLRPYHRFTTFRESPDMPEPIRTRMGSFSASRAIHLRIETLRTGMSGTEARGHVRPHPKGRLAAMENPGEFAPSQTISFGGFPQPHARCAP